MLVQLLLTRMQYITHIFSKTTVERRLYALAIAHFVLALIAAVVSILALISAIAFSTSMSGLMGGSAVDAFTFYRSLGTGTFVLGIVLSGVTALAGWNLLTLRWCRFGLVLEGATLFLFPFGTILAIASLAIMAQRSVRELFCLHSQAANAQ